MKGKPYQLSARNIGSNYLWQPSADLDITTSRTPVITPLQQREYQIKITSTDGCITTDTLLVQVLNKTEVFVPKAFTPNRNGVNDLLRPITVNIPLINYFKIYNRWGQLVFETRTQGDGWNGLYKGAAQPTETYTWIFEGKDSDGNLIKANGKTILIR
jgi:gliding motility-associated-like protein